MSSSDAGKRAAAYAAVSAHVTRDGMRLGIGSGSTVVFVVEALRALAASRGWRFVCVPTSFQSRALVSAGAPALALAELSEAFELDVCIDGADEVCVPSLAAVKGGGGCQAQEKAVASAAAEFVIVADDRKRVRGGLCAPGGAWGRGLPLEVLPAAHALVARRVVRELGAAAAPLRMSRDKAGPVVTDNGNLLLDARWPAALDDAAATDAALLALPGLVETGLFVRMAAVAYFGADDGAVTRVRAGGAEEAVPPPAAAAAH